MTPALQELQPLRQDYLARKQVLLAQLAAAGASVRGLHTGLRRLAQLADGVLTRLWQRAGFGDGCALLAVGGYGRGELFPCSDIDVQVLLPEAGVPAEDDALRTVIEGFITSCWDVGLEIGSSVRTVPECLQAAQTDLTVQTALLEARRITGSAALFESFQQRLAAQLDPLAFFTAKQLEMRQRHARQEDTPYALEPNCKESPGGLRDVQVIGWVARAAGLGGGWDELARNGLATPFEARQLRSNETLLSLIRTRLHLLAHRREDRLVFDLQTAVAESFGYANSFTADGRLRLRASEVLMRRYYWAAKAITQLNPILMQGLEQRLRSARGQQAPALRVINARFFDKGGMLEIAYDTLYREHPHAILETFLLYQREAGIKGLSARTLRALYNARTLMNSTFRADPVNRALFLQIMQQPQGITHALRLMNQTSVLGRYLWAFRRIVGQMQHDLFHVYTVDQHILMVLRNVRRLFMAEHAHEFPFCSQLAGGWDKPWILYIAALFHDIAKGRGGDHSELGAHEVRRFCREHGVAGADAALIEFLVREHLHMSVVAQKSDLADPAVIARFAQRVGNERNLTALYLLTVADIRGTSPKVWSAWKGKLLEDLYRATLRHLGGRAPDAEAELELRKREALQILAGQSLPHNAHLGLWQTLDVRYFMRHDAADIAWHTRHLSRWLADGARGQLSAEAARAPVVRARISPAGEGLQVLVYAVDCRDLFARICGYFDRARFSVLDARIYTTLDGRALDTYQVVTDLPEDEYRNLISLVESQLVQAIISNADLPVPSRGRVSRRVRSFPLAPSVELRPADDKAQQWLLSLSASDRAGLLYRVARVLTAHGLSVQMAKISTLGERVEDTFLIAGAALQESRTQLAIETELLHTLTTD